LLLSAPLHLQADKLLAMSDTVHVLRLLAAWLHDDKRHIQEDAKAFKAANGLAHKDGSKDVLDVDSKYYEVEQQKVEDSNFMQTVLNEYQVLLVSAGLRPSALARAPAWAATHPVMIAAPPPAAVLGPPPPKSSNLSSSSSSSSSNKINSSEELSSSSSSSIEQVRKRAGAERALMLPGHISHQVCAHAAVRRDIALLGVVCLIAITCCSQEYVETDANAEGGEFERPAAPMPSAAN
jgi:hypothetical protein